jgi:hypothetical protein
LKDLRTFEHPGNNPFCGFNRIVLPNGALNDGRFNSVALSDIERGIVREKRYALRFGLHFEPFPEHDWAAVFTLPDIPS